MFSVANQEYLQIEKNTKIIAKQMEVAIITEVYFNGST